MSNLSPPQAVDLLRQLSSIRERSLQLYQYVLEGKSAYFELDTAKLSNCCQFVLALAKKDNPTLEVPFHSRWRHFSVGNIDRVKHLQDNPAFPSDKQAQGRVWYELTLLSVLLDAGAGNDWRYLEKSSQQYFNRSEGLAVASLDMYREGLFSSNSIMPLQADIEGLQQFDTNQLISGMQVSKDNPLLGVKGRTNLINALAKAIQSKPQNFDHKGTLGGFYDYVIEQASIDNHQIDAAKVVSAVLETFSDIWPGRLMINEQNLGDVWRHHAVSGPGETDKLIPFHKLSQWLTYSLLEPLKWQGFEICGLEAMTGLAEYRNGGLFIDTGVISIKDPALRSQGQLPKSEAIIEWRALTICLLDELWQQALIETHKTKDEFPLVSFLEAGTWKAGRVTAFKNNPNGQPPISIISDGTVF